MGGGGGTPITDIFRDWGFWTLPLLQQPSSFLIFAVEKSHVKKFQIERKSIQLFHTVCNSLHCFELLSLTKSIYAVSLQFMLFCCKIGFSQFTHFCRKICFVAICALLCGEKFNQHIARGTTDPGYWVHSLNHLYHLNWFQIDLEIV